MSEEVYGNPRRKPAPTLYLAVLFVLGGAVLMMLDTFSTPYIKSIFFLQNNHPLGGNAKFGVFGWCVSDYCIPKQLGYSWVGAIPAGGKLTSALVLFPISAGFSILALISLLLNITTLNYGIPTFVLALLAFISSILAVIFSLAIWLSTKDTFGVTPKASYGPAFWMAIAAAGSLAVGCILLFLGDLRALRRGTNIEVVGGGYQAPPVVVVTEGDAGRSKSRFKWK